MSAVWSFSALRILAIVHQGGKHKPTPKPECVGEYFQFDQAVHFVDAVIVFFERLPLLRCHGVV